MANADPEREPIEWTDGTLPKHIAFIMDGNGRWARQRGLLRVIGHEHGANSLRRLTRYCRRLGVEQITFYALSTENFVRRPRAEVAVLMRLLKNFLISERPELIENEIRLRAIGDVEALPAGVLSELRETERVSAGGKRMILRLALNYGSRQEILRAAGRVAQAVVAGEMTADAALALSEEDFARHLYDVEMTDPDLLVRTAGEYRLSNFLLWQCSYSELWVTETLWPDFDVEEFQEALRDFGQRDRKYGAVSGSCRGS